MIVPEICPNSGGYQNIKVLQIKQDGCQVLTRILRLINAIDKSLKRLFIWCTSSFPGSVYLK